MITVRPDHSFFRVSSRSLPSTRLRPCVTVIVPASKSTSAQARPVSSPGRIPHSTAASTYAVQNTGVQNSGRLFLTAAAAASSARTWSTVSDFDVRRLPAGHCATSATFWPASPSRCARRIARTSTPWVAEITDVEYSSLAICCRNFSTRLARRSCILTSPSAAMIRSPWPLTSRMLVWLLIFGAATLRLASQSRTTCSTVTFRAATVPVLASSAARAASFSTAPGVPSLVLVLLGALTLRRMRRPVSGLTPTSSTPTQSLRASGSVVEDAARVLTSPCHLDLLPPGRVPARPWLPRSALLAGPRGRRRQPRSMTSSAKPWE
jgi:hypothetical protein